MFLNEARSNSEDRFEGFLVVPTWTIAARCKNKTMSASTERRDRALAVFAHELREPLASILLAARALLEIGSDDSIAHRELSSMVERQGQYLARLIDGVLEASSLECGRFQLRKEWFDLRRLLQDTADMMTPGLRQRGHRLQVSLPSEPVYLMADALRVKQVVVNLLANAGKYTDPGGHVGLNVKRALDHLTIEVRDSGVGISAELLPRIFDSFQRGAPPTPNGYSGLGVGLTVVKLLVEMHGGHVRAHSDGPGAGSTFTVQLPIFCPTATAKHSPSQGTWNLTTGGVSQDTANPMLDA